MILNVYAIKDKVADQFGNIFCDQSDVQASRGFSYAVNAKDGLMNFAPDDYELFRLGQYDSEKGEISSITPKFICSGTSVYHGDD